MIHSTGSLFYSDASARALPGRMHFYKLPVYSSNGQAKPAHFKIFAPQKYLYAAVRRRGPAARTIPLGIPPNITFPPIRVVAKSALLRFLPFGESSARSLAPPFPAVTAPLGPGGNFTLRPIGQSRWEFPPNITFPPIHSNGEWGAYSLIGLSNGRYLVLS